MRYMILVFFMVLSFVWLCENLVVTQYPNFIAGRKGHAITLNCDVVQNKSKEIHRPVLYWYIKLPGQEPMVIHPERTKEYGDRVERISPNSQTDKSVKIHGLRFSDSRIYYCMMSFVFNEKPVSKDGTGTQVFVHGPMEVCSKNNDTVLVCETSVPKVEDVSITWLNGDTEVPAEDFTVQTTYTESESYCLVSALNISTGKQHNSTSYYCVLRHRAGGMISNASWDLPVTNLTKPGKEPVLLYTLFILNGVVILIIIVCYLLYSTVYSQHRSQYRRPILVPQMTRNRLR
ncbi:uncharacterized protein LOC122809177 [Protopterus annectens]|uniref:uncharacterized protein LOC122809177 n=1 Tax=Protopterus annectens TaxID=7888 RepID=UPI001CFAF934|nr:uncharacterized protein LOC122809177 [Protopterus annectens]XP_043936412.1 uncharacterized protein LOC122809177 [Protopterus annectens]